MLQNQVYPPGNPLAALNEGIVQIPIDSVSRGWIDNVREALKIMSNGRGPGADPDSMPDAAVIQFALCIADGEARRIINENRTKIHFFELKEPRQVRPCDGSTEEFVTKPAGHYFEVEGDDDGDWSTVPGPFPTDAESRDFARKQYPGHVEV